MHGFEGLRRAHTVRFLIVVCDCCLSDSTNMMIMSHCGISDVINVRLYDSHDKNRCAQENSSGVLHYQPIHAQDCELHYMWGWNVGYHEKYMNGGNTGIFRKNNVSNTHPHKSSSTTSVYHSKGNISCEFREWRTGAPEFMAVRRNL